MWSRNAERGGFRRGRMCVAFLAVPLVFGCGRDDTRGSVSDTRQAADQFPALNSFITDWIQIDQLTNDPTNPADANLFTGPDPADGSASVDKPPKVPANAPGSFKDWNDLGLNATDLANHRILDLNDASGKDPTSFPQSNECVAPSQVLSKMDLTYVAAASNTTYFYIAVQRSNNNGDAGYYWIITQKTPKQIPGPSGPCSASQAQLLYDITDGDVLLGGHFQGNGAPLLRFFQHKGADQLNVTAVDAIDYTNATLWTENPSAVVAAAVNSTITAPGSFGVAGVVKTALKNGNLDTELFAEAAIPISFFTGGAICGKSFYGSVITRSSGSGGTSPDLKDLVGPFVLNLGKATATASVSPTCDLHALYQASLLGPDNQPVANPTCSWTFTDANNVQTTASTCVNNTPPGFPLAAGNYTVSVDVSDPSSGCSDTVNNLSVKVLPPLSASATLTPHCNLTFDYSGSGSGGSGSGYKFAWTFSGPGTPVPSSSTTQSGTGVTVPTSGLYTGNLTVTDPRTDIECTAPASASTTPLAPLAVTIAPSATSLTCPSMTTDAVTYTATPSGGNGLYSYLWSGSLSCSSGGGINDNFCGLNPPDQNFCDKETVQVQLSDSSGICLSANSNIGNYTKVTIVTAN